MVTSASLARCAADDHDRSS